MFNTISLRYILERKLSTLIASALMFLLAIMYIALYQGMRSTVATLIKDAPDALTAIVGNLNTASSPNGWLNLELFSIFFPIALGSIGIMFGSGAIGKEEEKGTLELLLASPVSRQQIILRKALGFSLQTVIITLSAWLGVAFGSLVFTFNVNLLDVFYVVLSGWVLSLFFGFITLGAQSISGKRVVGLGVGIGLLVFSYFVEILSKILESLHFLRFVSPFYYYNSESNLLGDVSYIKFLVLIGVALLALLISVKSFQNRDTGV